MACVSVFLHSTLHSFRHSSVIYIFFCNSFVLTSHGLASVFFVHFSIDPFYKSVLFFALAINLGRKMYKTKTKMKSFDSRFWLVLFYFPCKVLCSFLPKVIQFCDLVVFPFHNYNFGALLKRFERAISEIMDIHILCQLATGWLRLATDTTLRSQTCWWRMASWRRLISFVCFWCLLMLSQLLNCGWSFYVKFLSCCIKKLLASRQYTTAYLKVWFKNLLFYIRLIISGWHS